MGRKHAQAVIVGSVRTSSLLSALCLCACSFVYEFEEKREDTQASCSNYVDDNEDGLVDCEDPQCHLAGHCTEGSSVTCDDQLDNDGNGKTDCADSDCDGYCEEDSMALCEDSRDNDLDGLTDLEDPRCWAFTGLQQESCLSSDPVQLAVDLWSPTSTLKQVDTPGGVAFVSKQALDGNWRELNLFLSLKNPKPRDPVPEDPTLKDSTTGEPTPVENLKFDRMEIALLPSAPGDEIPTDWKSEALFYVGATEESSEVHVMGEKSEFKSPIESLRIIDGKIFLRTQGDDKVSAEVKEALEDLPLRRPARLLVRAPTQKNRDQLLSACSGSSEAPPDPNMSWLLTLSAPGRLPCGEFFPFRGVTFDEEGGMCAAASERPEVAEPSSILPAGGAESVGLGGPAGTICEVGHLPPLELAGGAVVPVIRHSIVWDERAELWRAVGWTAAQQLLLLSSPDCHSWTRPYLARPNRIEGELGLPSYVVGGPFAYPAFEGPGPQHHIFYSVVADGAKRRLFHLSSEDALRWTEPEAIYSFLPEDLVREPIRVVSLGETELALVYRLEEAIRSSVGVLLATQPDLKEWTRAAPWPFRMRSSDPSMVDSLGLGGAVLYFRDGEGELYVEGRPADSYRVLGGDLSGKVNLSRPKISESGSVDAASEELASLARFFPAVQLFGSCNDDGTCDPGESCSWCSKDCECEEDLLNGRCWESSEDPSILAPTTFSEQRKSLIVKEKEFTLRGRVHIASSELGDLCLPYVALGENVEKLGTENDEIVDLSSEDGVEYDGTSSGASLVLSFSPDPLVYAESTLWKYNGGEGWDGGDGGVVWGDGEEDDGEEYASEGIWGPIERWIPEGEPTATSSPSVFSEWSFQFKRESGTLSLTVWNPLGCEVIGTETPFEEEAEALLSLGAVSQCGGAILSELSLLGLEENP